MKLTIAIFWISIILFISFGCATTQEGYEKGVQSDYDVVFDFGPHTKTGEEPVVVVLPFENKSTLDFDFLGDSVSSVYETALVKSRRVELIDRKNLDAMMEEMKLSLSGMVDDASALEFGKLVNANYMVTGVIAEYSVKSIQKSAGCAVGLFGTGAGAGAREKEGTARMAVEIKVIDIETSRVLFADTAVGEYYTNDFDGGMKAFLLYAETVNVGGKAEVDFGSTLIGKTTRQSAYNCVNAMIRDGII